MERAFPKDSTSTWNNQDSNPGLPDLKANCLSLDHDATKFNLVIRNEKLRSR